jgi:hypothetical protein
LLGHHLSLGLAVLLATAIATAARAAEDNSDTKRCGGYYACVELQPTLPDYTFGQWRFFHNNPGSAAP